jgi:tetratricopeptide (TPR) repeat protein
VTIPHPLRALFSIRLVQHLPILALIAIAACVHGGNRAEDVEDRPREIGARAEEVEEEAVVETPAAEPTRREIDRNRSNAIDSGAGTPQRRASLRVVEEGRGHLLSGRTRDATVRFQRALQIDPTNGFAYYWLGRARIASGDARGAVGVLQKAESLLGPYPEWRQQASQLLASLGAR